MDSTKRTGVLGVKIGVLPQWTKDGTKLFTTLVQIIDNHVIRYVPPEDYKQSSAATLYMKNRNYGSVVVGALSCYPTSFTKSYVNLFNEAGVPPKRKLTRFLVTPDAAIEPGTPLTAKHFNVGDYVDVQARTIGHGFQGVVKRWGFKGGPKSHGATKWHRRPGTIASGGRTGLIYKGKKMPGKMGNRWRNHRGLKIWRINYKYNVLYLTGPATPGPTHSYIRIYDTILPNLKKEMTSKEVHPPMPTAYPEDFSEGLPEEVFDDELFQFNDPTLMYNLDEK
ncbi:DgyrCDS347 [Dimorphilus gyrociliatus]|uniref:Large ribosomal subunit protein uL3m n=1 Tax=Dimorphilus gyrociliatus TaxID=2664684 RepID=A0A7I8V726_9ANNE|nr:DgyrCDS347 [Dimorphilus gyrociliatus]